VWWRYCTPFLAITDRAAVVAIGRIGYLVEIKAHSLSDHVKKG
jgi:hypothetical protein